MAPGSVQNAFLDNYQAVVSAFGEFLTVAVHTILYERDIYPRTSFLRARKYNYAVRQNRHPKVCQWIQDAVAAVEGELLKVRVLNHNSSSRAPLCYSTTIVQGLLLLSKTRLYHRHVKSLKHDLSYCATAAHLRNPPGPSSG